MLPATHQRPGQTAGRLFAGPRAQWLDNRSREPDGPAERRAGSCCLPNAPIIVHQTDPSSASSYGRFGSKLGTPGGTETRCAMFEEIDLYADDELEGDDVEDESLGDGLVPRMCPGC